MLDPDHPLEVEQLDPDPVRAFADWLTDATAAGEPQPEAMALATAGPGGAPAVRMVLLKGWDARGLVFFTNYESAKGADLARNPQAAVAFFWPRLHRQVRVTGSVARISRRDSAAYFETRPHGARIGALASPQSQVLPDRAALEARVQALAARYPERVPLPASWGGYRIRPTVVEFWQGRRDRLHDRVRYRLGRAGGWSRQRLAP